ncbi:uncharacterized protein LOC141599100 isoform X2 [Silene latifolia]|uniref:uncharacterized protein LOC141599100 isoform X2 n=1 Tax=Silene latifolia TaxID=37657 RepID=UPI003D76A588
MELFRSNSRKKGKIPRVSTIVRHGDQIVEKPNNLLKVSSFPDSISGTSVEAQESVSSRLSVGTTMKKLLADELKGENESGRRSPSIIANLMGLEWLPATNNVSKQHKRVSENYQKKCNSTGLGKSSKVNDGRSHRNHERGRQSSQQCKDVYEIAERSNTETGSTTSRAASMRNRSDEDEVAFVRQKFMDVKRFSTDEKLRHSKEFHDALEVLDSNKDLLLKFLQEPNSLFTKHLHNLHGARESHCGRVEGMKSLSNLKSNVDVIGSQLGGEASQKIDISRSRKHFDEHQSNLNRRRNVDSHKLHFSAVGKEDTTSIATTIVVLKPNLGKARDILRSVSSTTPSRDFASDNELQNGYSNIMQHGSEMICKRNKHDDPNFCATKSRESRELAREVTRRMKNKSRVDSFDVPSSGYKGYSADESSGDISENESSYEPEVTVFDKTILRSVTPLNRGIPNTASTSASASPYIESSINKEGKKRLSKRWEMTHRSQEIGSSGKGSTLAEMLAIPDVDVRPHSPNYVTVRNEHLHRCGRDAGTTEVTAPLGISSRDGWKDGGGCNSSRSRSLSASSIHFGSPKSSSRHEAITAERFLVRSRSMDFGKNKAFHRDSERKQGSSSGSTRSRKKEIQLTFMEITDDRQEVPSGTNTVANSIDGKDSPDVKSVIIETSSCKHVPVNAAVDTERNSINTPLNCPDEPVPTTVMQSTIAPQDCFNFDLPSVQQEPSSGYYVENPSCLQLSATQPESSASSKESEQPSPVSVLEPPFVEEVSSGSECFERVSAGLHGLRMQLQLLKQESETYDEGSILISSDESEEESTKPDNGAGLCVVEESWESSYFVELLTCSGLEEIDIDIFLETWHSPNCPINPCVFDNLEKKCGGWKSCSRSERKLLFDHINAEIVQIVCRHVDIEPWVKPLIRNLGPQLSRDRLISELRNLLKNDELVTEENVTDAAILRKENVLEAAILGGMQWFKLGDQIGAVGRDVELLLIDELVSEFLSL